MSTGEKSSSNATTFTASEFSQKPNFSFNTHTIFFPVSLFFCHNPIDFHDGIEKYRTREVLQTVIFTQNVT